MTSTTSADDGPARLPRRSVPDDQGDGRRPSHPAPLVPAARGGTGRPGTGGGDDAPYDELGREQQREQVRRVALLRSRRRARRVARGRVVRGLT